jgi:DNA-directed RNA polymerase specialized sigma subunit
MPSQFKWERLSRADIERLVRVCNLSEVERRILELRRKRIALDVVADEIGYSSPQMYRLSKKLLAKISKEL